MVRKVAETVGGHAVLTVDTIAHVKPEDEGAIVMTGSHGGISSGEYAGRAPIRAVFFNDAGIGKDKAGTAALPYLGARGIIAGTVSHNSAAIGNAGETWNHGVISALNRLGQEADFRVGEPIRQAVRRVFGAGR
jgi:hypothetical protein